MSSRGSRSSTPSTRSNRSRSSNSSRSSNRSRSSDRESPDDDEEEKVFQFHEYVYGHNFDEVEKMLSKDSSLINKNEENTPTRDLPIITAIQSVKDKGTPEAFNMFKNLLRKRNIDIMAKTKLKTNALFFAMSQDLPNVVRSLVYKEPRLLNVKTVQGQIGISSSEVGLTPLGLARKRYSTYPTSNLSEIIGILENGPQRPVNPFSRRQGRRRGGKRLTKKRSKRRTKKRKY